MCTVQLCSTRSLLRSGFKVKKAFLDINWEEKDFCKKSGNGAKKRAIRFLRNSKDWDRPLIGTERHSQWMRLGF